MTSPTNPPAKRRRLLQSSDTLAKPFKSPLRLTTANRSFTQPTAADETQHEPRAAHYPQTPAASQTTSTAQTHTSPIKVPEGPTAIESISPRRSAPSTNVTSTQQQKEFSELSRDLETIRQAEKIVASGEDKELHALIAKWKVASRELADEAFSAARDRVNRMGGLGAWKASRGRPSGWDDQDEASQVEHLSDEQREAFDIAKEESMAEATKYGTLEPNDRQEEAEDGDDESFTMAMMLESLNIDLRLIGYDKENQCWED